MKKNKLKKRISELEERLSEQQKDLFILLDVNHPEYTPTLIKWDLKRMIGKAMDQQLLSMMTGSGFLNQPTGILQQIEEPDDDTGNKEFISSPS